MCAIPSAIRRSSCIVAISLSILGSVALVASDDDGEPRERVILMTTGRVLTGVATRNAGGWLVEQGNGRIHVPIEQVAFVATSLVDAYRQQRDSVVKPTPATHLALAQWCLSYRLHDEARDELRKCLKLDPDHSTARKLLNRVDESLDPATPKKVAPVIPRTSDGFLVPDAESLGGLSNEAAMTFTQRIQPLLMNKCGNASCHGLTTRAEAATGFHLIPVRNGSNSHRIYSERNLAEILRHIDISDPACSPLLAVPQGSHGGTAGIFHGANGNAQLKMLRAWIKTVANEKQADEEELAARPSVVSKGRRPIASPAANPPAVLDDDVAGLAVPIEISGRSMNKVVTAQFSDEFNPSYKKVVEATAERRAAPLGAGPKDTPKSVSKDPDKPGDDPFDPEVFNRRFHSKRR